MVTDKLLSNYSVLGSAGGVSKALLSILNKSAQDENDPIHPFIVNLNLHLIDNKQKNIDYYKNLFPNLAKKLSIYNFDLNNSIEFENHLKRTQTSLVIDCSFADTVETLRSCDELGVNYINTAFENTMIDETESFDGFGLIERRWP